MRGMGLAQPITEWQPESAASTGRGFKLPLYGQDLGPQGLDLVTKGRDPGGIEWCCRPPRGGGLA